MEEKYLFVLGKFPKLSAYELESYLLARGIQHRSMSELSDELVPTGFSVHKFQDKINAAKMIGELGGTVKIGKVLLELPTSVISNAFSIKSGKNRGADSIPASCAQELRAKIEIEAEPKEILGLMGEATEIIVSVYPWHESVLEHMDWEHLARFFGEEFASILGTGKIHIRPASETKNAKSSFVIPSEAYKIVHSKGNAELIIAMTHSTAYFAVTQAVYDIEDEEKRGDILARPGQWKFGMRTRLAKIMVNLSRAKEGDTLLDPFCGIGTILTEAIHNGINVCGSDIDADAVRFAQTNAQNAVKNAGAQGRRQCPDLPNRILGKSQTCGLRGAGAPKYKLKVGDAQKLDIADESIDAVASEPTLGPSLQVRPRRDQALQTMEELAPLYFHSLVEIQRVLKTDKCAAIISPLISTSSGFVHANFASLARDIGFIVKGPYVEGEDFQLVKREIFVLKKQKVRKFTPPS